MKIWSLKTWMVGWALVLATSAPTLARAADTLVASQACPAYQSISKKTNPGNIHLTTGQTYAVVARNKQPATFLQVTIDGASPRQRWVAVSCGAAGGAPGPAPGPGPTPAPGPAGGPAADLLALSWEPTFCQSMGGKDECRGETSQSPEARRLSLHGLWPEPNGTFYCIADSQQKAKLSALDNQHRWDQLPDPGLTPATHARLAAVMPGTQSLLERHEWVKHGTCFGTTAEVYFNRAAGLVEQVNASAVGQLLAANVGKSVSASQILAAFKTDFGDAAPAAVVVTCKKVGGVSELSEIDVYLAGNVTGADPLSKLLHNAPSHSNCASGMLVKPPT